MSGIYIHIPFCKQACSYCNFHFSTTRENQNVLVDAINKEIILQKEILEDSYIQTIYLGGGTPSLLTKQQLDSIFSRLKDNFEISDDAEITLEANPDDLSLAKIDELAKSPINRLSIGVQSFYDTDLRFLNRAHNSSEAHDSIRNSQDAGFENISVDLIFAIPGSNEEQWASNLKILTDLKIKHISAYGLEVEENTALAHDIIKGTITPVDEDSAARQFEHTMTFLEDLGYEHYEISSYCKDGQYAKHNTNYWKGISYLGIGPSAHSYYKHAKNQIRQWNVSNNVKYIQAVSDNNVPFEQEILTIANTFNEYVMTSLRTMWGCDMKELSNSFPLDYTDQLHKKIQSFLKNETLSLKDNKLQLTRKGKLLADNIISELFIG
ncbi:MAG: radical SAM family heme chaperone HemW [Bacteroidetes bacterium]|nr:radical SAM family heme chaperone HemW [Bacteroidota bacterium]